MRRFLALAAVLPRYGTMKRRKAIIYGVFACLLLCFIWGQSMLPRDASAGESGYLMRLIKPLLDPAGNIDEVIFHHYLRKTAHFTEYAALGFFLCGFYKNLGWKRGPSLCTLCAIASCILAAAADESIQLFSVDRGPHIRDVILDSCGALFGLAIFLLLSAIIKIANKKE